MTETCCCGAECKLHAAGGKCTTDHKCLHCDRYMHAICGYPVPEDDPRHTICYSQICNECGDKKESSNNNNNNDDDDDDDDDDVLDNVPLNDLKKQAPAKKRKRKQKKPARATRPDVTYEDDAAADPSSWQFPTDKPEYLAPFLDFMGFIDNKVYTKGATFTKERLMSLQPKHVLAYLTHKAFGVTRRQADSRPSYARSNHIKNIKMKLSHFMPSGAAWADLPSGGHGNPTRHKLINKLIADIIQFEIRGEGSDARDVRDQTVMELQKELELFRQHKDPICRYRNPLMGLYQYNFITRADDVCNFKLDAPKSHPLFEFTLAQKVNWSKNVRDHRNCPDQLLLASMDHKTCLTLALVLWLEYFLNNYPDAEYMMTQARPEGKSKKEHKKFTAAISKTHRNRLNQVVWKNESFKGIYKGSDKRPLGLHSKRKMGSTQAKRRGASGDYVDHRGRWVAKKGSRIVNAVYIDPEDTYADAVVASKLALGGPIKYKVKAEVSSVITLPFLSEHVVPRIAQRFPQDPKLIQAFGVAMLWLALDGEAAEDLDVPTNIKERITAAYEAINVENKPEQPIERVPLHVYRSEDETTIDEVVQRQQAGAADDEAQVPLDGSSGATNHVLQTLVCQQRNLQRQFEDLQTQMHQMDQSNRVHMENKFRAVNNNVRRFGGTIQSGLSRQDPQRQAQVQRAAAERAPGTYVRHGRVWPKLSPNVKDLMVLWGEYEHGIAGGKPAKSWTREERGGGGNNKVKQTFYRRNNIWKIQKLLINKGHSVYDANAIIETTYGSGSSITAISAGIVRDRKVYHQHGGLHPNFR